jgi:hypothetical protein
MSDSPTLDRLVAVRQRFARSVSLARDAHRSDALDGYILTPTGRDVLRRLAGALRGETPTRAWSLTGPYGSGKSAFALLAAQALAGEPWVRDKARHPHPRGRSPAAERCRWHPPVRGARVRHGRVPGHGDEALAVGYVIG